MSFWQKFLTTAACVAMCLPLQVLESCCCAEAARIDGTAVNACCTVLAHSTLSHAISAGKVIKSTTATEPKLSKTAGCCQKACYASKISKHSGLSSGCGVKSAIENAGENGFTDVVQNECGLDGQCSCCCLSAPLNSATTIKAVDLSFDWVAVALSVANFATIYKPSYVARVCDRPPIAHNRRQSQLCVWQN